LVKWLIGQMVDWLNGKELPLTNYQCYSA